MKKQIMIDGTDLPDTLVGPRWSLHPRLPWKLTDLGGKLVARFALADDAEDWMHERGYWV